MDSPKLHMHEEIKELLGGYALDTLDNADRVRLEAHLAAGCDACASELAEFESVAADLIWATEPASPSPALRSRVLAAIGEQAGDTSSPVVPFPGRRGPAPSVGGAFGALAALAAAAVIAIAFLTWSLLSATSDLEETVRQLADARKDAEQVQRELDERDRLLALAQEPGVQVTRLTSSGTPPEPSIDVLWQPDRNRGVLLARNLPSIPDEKAYELWLIADGAPVPASVFKPDQFGNAIVEIDEIPNAALPKLFAVTVEPTGGSPAPTMKPILVGEYAKG